MTLRRPFVVSMTLLFRSVTVGYYFKRVNFKHTSGIDILSSQANITLGLMVDDFVKFR